MFPSTKRRSSSLDGPSPIVLANQEVSIVTVCARFGADLPDYLISGSYKTHCPFSELHPDRGMEKSFRVYPETNSAFCFTESLHLTPVSLAALKWDVSWKVAAERLLEERPSKGLLQAQAAQCDRVDEASLGAALQVYCRSVCPSWEEVQFDPTVSNTLSGGLSLLSMVKTPADAVQWLQACKLAMDTVLGARP